MLQNSRKIGWVAVLMFLTTISVFAQPTIRPAASPATQNAQLLRRIDGGLSRYRASLDVALGQSRNTDPRTANQLFQDLDASVTQVQKLFNENQLATTDVYDMMARANQMDEFMQTARLGRQAESDWFNVRGDIAALSSNYGVSAGWNDRNNAPPSRTTADDAGRTAGGLPPRNGTGNGRAGRGTRPNYEPTSLLTGTYRLDTTRSDDVNQVANRAARSVTVRERKRLSESLVEKLATPQEFAVDQRGTLVSYGTANETATTYEADGRANVERAPNGATLRTQATLGRDRFEVRTSSDRNDSSSLLLEALDGGRTLRVTRQVVDTRIPQPVVAVSFYQKVSDVAQLNENGNGRGGIVNDDDDFGSSSNSGNNGGGGYNGASDDFLIGDGVKVMGVLNEDLSTKTAREGDRFTITVKMPQQYEGAVIEGYVSGLSRSGRVSGRSAMTFNFERIRLLDGTTYRFAGAMESVYTASGERVTVDNEGTVADSNNRTKTTATRAGVGSAVGAAIGAIAGGGKGAAIGAIIGAGGGAGSVYAEGRDELELQRGAEVYVRASAPRIR